MRRLLICVIALFAFSAFTANAAFAFDVHLISETSTTITLGWDAQPGFGYIFSANGSEVSFTRDASRTTVTFSKGADSYDVDVIQKGENGHFVYVPPTACADGLDNDGDGRVDLNDPGCMNAEDNDETDPPPVGETITRVNQKYVCSGPVNLALVKVTVDSTHMVTPAVQIAAGCTGTIGRIEIDNANGDGIHVGAFAHDLTVGGGYVHSPLGGCDLCGPVHVDGIQFLGGQRITFNNMDVNYQTATNSALYINCGRSCQDRPTDIIFDHSTFRRSPTRNRVVRIGDSLRSGITNSTVYWCGTGSTCDAPNAGAIWYNGLATDPIPPGNGDWGSNTLIAIGG